MTSCKAPLSKKCPIHLIRDINQGLLELALRPGTRSIAGAVWMLPPCPQIIATVDERGLKRRDPPARHSRRIKVFLIQLSDPPSVSEDAEALHKRLLRESQNKLFTFIQHDGGRLEQQQRRERHQAFCAPPTAHLVVLMKEGGLDDYLVLLKPLYATPLQGRQVLKSRLVVPAGHRCVPRTASEATPPHYNRAVPEGLRLTRTDNAAKAEHGGGADCEQVTPILWLPIGGISTSCFCQSPLAPGTHTDANAVKIRHCIPASQAFLV